MAKIKRCVNPIARVLRTPMFRKRVVKSKVVYNRKKGSDQ